MSSRPLILVTGVSGFVGSHVAYQLLEAGYSVRGTVREDRASSLRATAGAQYPNLEIVQVNDISSADLTEAFKGVGAVIHVASPMAALSSAEAFVNTSINGVKNVLHQATQNGVKKVVLTSSSAVTHRLADMGDTWKGITWNRKSWGKASLEEATREGQGMQYAYVAAKILAESEAWTFAKAHPELDLATIIPPYIYGPYAPHFPFRGANAGTNGFVNALITGPAGRAPSPSPFPYFIDVRDVARAHVAALSAPSVPQGEEKRFLVAGGHFTWRDAAEHLKRARPELANRLPEVGEEERSSGKLSAMDLSEVKTVLGLTEFIGWEKCVEDTINALLEEEKKQN